MSLSSGHILIVPRCSSGFDGYLTNRTINGQIAQQEKGAAVVLEHRFYGLSNPLPDLSVVSLKLHTIQQAIDDLEYFAQNVKLPQPDGDNIAPGKAPWVLIGGSYSGALTSFTVVKYVFRVIWSRKRGSMLILLRQQTRPIPSGVRFLRRRGKYHVRPFTTRRSSGPLWHADADHLRLSQRFLGIFPTYPRVHAQKLLCRRPRRHRAYRLRVHWEG